jgi:hypothetical protein
MRKTRRGKIILLVGLPVACLLVAVGAGVLIRQAWLFNPGWPAALGQPISWLPAPTGIPTPEPTPTLVIPPDPTSPPIVLAFHERNEESSSPQYTLEARWPYLEWGGDPRATAFNQQVEGMVEEEIRAFLTHVAQITDPPAPEVPGSSLLVTYSVPYTQNGIISVLLRFSYYSAGAAHPGSYSRSLNYDLRSAKEIALAELFQPGSDYLGIISSGCLADLKKRDILAWEDGALPKAENYSVWNITPDGLQITFDEYQVAPYAAGPQVVVLPYAKMVGIVRDDGPLPTGMH